MFKCRVCGKGFPTYIKIDGKLRNLCNRTKCFECQPWKAPRYPVRTKQQSIAASRAKAKKYYYKMSKKLGINPVAYRCCKRKKRLVEALGGQCLICGYKRCLRNLHFHHIRKKEFDLTSNNMSLSLAVLFNELQKCILLCSICHGEVHSDILKIHQKIKQTYMKRLLKIKEYSWKKLFRIKSL